MQAKSITNFEMDSSFRPYSGGMSDREPSMATIILLQQTQATKSTQQNSGLYDSFYNSVTNTSVDLTAVPSSDSSKLTDIVGGGDGSLSVPILDMGFGSTKYYGVFNNFSLQSVSEAREDLIKINMNFGGNWNAFFFGENPRVFQCSGVLLDSPEYPYYQEFITAYDKYLSGRKCIINKMKLIMSYDGRIVSGYILKMMNDLSSEQYRMKQFSFTLLVDTESWFRTNIRPDGTMGLNYLYNDDRYDNLSKSNEIKSVGIDGNTGFSTPTIDPVV